MRSDDGLALDWDGLRVLFPEFEDPGRWLVLLRRHAALLEQAAPRVRVTSVPPELAIRRHYAESLELLRILLQETTAASVGDVGSGGGFPGLVMACLLPGAAFHLVEPHKKRAHLLQEMCDALELTNVTVFPVRAEEAGRGPLRDSLPLVTARAVAATRVLVEYTAPLVAAGGMILLPKGSGFQDELIAAGGAISALNCRLERVVELRPEISPHAVVVVLQKLNETPLRYPRRPGMAEKRPI